MIKLKKKNYFNLKDLLRLNDWKQVFQCRLKSGKSIIAQIFTLTKTDESQVGRCHHFIHFKLTFKNAIMDRGFVSIPGHGFSVKLIRLYRITFNNIRGFAEARKDLSKPLATLWGFGQGNLLLSKCHYFLQECLSNCLTYWRHRH